MCVYFPLFHNRWTLLTNIFMITHFSPISSIQSSNHNIPPGVISSMAVCGSQKKTSQFYFSLCFIHIYPIPLSPQIFFNRIFHFSQPCEYMWAIPRPTLSVSPSSIPIPKEAKKEKNIYKIKFLTFFFLGANKLDFYSTPLARSLFISLRTIPFSTLEGIRRIKARFFFCYSFFVLCFLSRLKCKYYTHRTGDSRSDCTTRVVNWRNEFLIPFFFRSLSLFLTLVLQHS